MISVVMLCKNDEARIEKVLRACVDFSEVLLIDTGSEDSTLKIAKKYPNTHIHQGDLSQGFGKLRNQAAKLAKNSWIFALDTDEVPSYELLHELSHTQLQPNCVYQFPFHNYYGKKQIKYCGWYPESHIRLYNREHTRFSDDYIHEGIISSKSEVHTFQFPIVHTSYESIEDFLIKMHRYGNLFAEQNRGKKHSSFKKALAHGIFAFFKSYFLKSGFLGGKEGFIISWYNANTAFYKYLKLAEANCS